MTLGNPVKQHPDEIGIPSRLAPAPACPAIVLTTADGRGFYLALGSAGGFLHIRRGNLDR